MGKIEFFTEVKVSQSPLKISHKYRLLLMGSCFTDEIGAKFERSGFETKRNPFGTIYNPISIARLLIRAVRKEYFTITDVVRSGEYYYLFEAHGDIRGTSVEDVLNLGNSKLEDLHDYLQGTTIIFLTLGTAWSYWYKEGEILMANCHKIPSKMISRRLLGVEEIEKWLRKAISCLRESVNKDIRVVFTVSPVRHIGEGLYDNKLSKATLHLAVDKVLEGNEYFPSYEIVMDELRDYRFYAKDMVHLSETAVDYIWQKFSQCYFAEGTMAKAEKYIKLDKMRSHRPFNPDSEGYKQHLEKIKELERELEKE